MQLSISIQIKAIWYTWYQVEFYRAPSSTGTSQKLGLFLTANGIAQSVAEDDGAKVRASLVGNALKWADTSRQYNVFVAYVSVLLYYHNSHTKTYAIVAPSKLKLYCMLLSRKPSASWRL